MKQSSVQHFFSLQYFSFRNRAAAVVLVKLRLGSDGHSDVCFKENEICVIFPAFSTLSQIPILLGGILKADW